jgi:hypothetical protein
VAIQNAGEFEVTLSDILLNVDRMIHEQPKNAKLVGARRQLGLLSEIAKKKQQPSQQQVESFAAAAESIRSLSDDSDMADRLYDLMDWLEHSRPQTP